MKHLKSAKIHVGHAETRNIEQAPANALVAIAHAAIALVELLAERLPPLAETASARHVRLQKEKHNGV